MKKFILISLAIALATGVSAQVSMTNPNGLALDTASQAAAEAPSLQVKQAFSTLSITLPLTKISGTIAGTVQWQVSNDGSNWFTVQTDTLTDASKTWGYSESPKRWLYYRALITQTGTSSLSYKAILYTTKL